MLISSLKSKISYATVTQKDLFYVGSITIDSDIMRVANIRANEEVHIVNQNNGERFTTYVIEGEPGSRVIGINGPAARKAEVGDTIFILSYGSIDPDKETLEPVLIDMNEENITCQQWHHRILLSQSTMMAMRLREQAPFMVVMYELLLLNTFGHQIHKL